MAILSLTSPSILSPLHTKTNSSPCFSTFSPYHSSVIRRSSFIVFSNSPKEAASKELYERYGLNPNDFLPEPSSKRKKRKENGKEVGREKQVVDEEPKPQRTTHKLLQVLAGKTKRKKLLSPVGMNVRPMMEVVKGSAFDILQAAGGCPASLRPGRWLDLYSGTGSVGIEALSRGCAEVVEYPLGTDMLDSCGCLFKITDRRFGRTNLAIYGPKWAIKKRK